MYLNIVFLPLIGSFLAGAFGSKLGGRGAGIITFGCVLTSLLLSFFAFYEVGLHMSPCYFKLLTWFNLEYFRANWGFQFDSLTVVMLIVVTFISSLVHLYSTEYMSHDPHLPRFMSYLSLFTFFMLILVTADNLVQLFVGWEGVGFCSYLLINFWFTRIQANKAAIKAMILNRIGDFGLALGIFSVYFIFHSVEYSTIFALVPFFDQESLELAGYSMSWYTVIGLLLFIGAIGKSAQLGLHTWLPDAMEGPTPVSALIHAATMVTAGVFLLARCSPLFEYTPTVLIVITLVGAATAFFAATTGLLQNDLKRVIAYSTCSQLGYMVFACGVSNYSVGMFHLANHAFFKALLFLGAGSVIHAVADEQDIRRMGGLRRTVPFTFAVMMIGSLALMGFPFLTGFYSKDVILEVSFGAYTSAGHFAYLMGTLAAFCTAFYSTRLLYFTFLAKPNGFRAVIIGAHDSPWRMAVPLFILTFPSIFIGYVMRDCFIGLGTPFWNGALFVFPTSMNLVDAEFAPIFYKLLPLMFSLGGLLIGFILYTFYSKELYMLKTSKYGRKVYVFLNKKWLFDKVYNEFIAQVLLNWGYSVTYKTVDRGFIEMIGPFGLTKLAFSNTAFLARFQSGSFYDYAFWMFGGILLFGVGFDLSGSMNLLDPVLLFVFGATFFSVYNR